MLRALKLNGIERVDMSTDLFPCDYDELVDEDIEWLKANAPHSCERDHILDVLAFSKREYRLRGYDEATGKTGPHYKQEAPNVCTDCTHADSWGLPDKPCCRTCVGNSNWAPLNKSSVHPNKQR